MLKNYILSFFTASLLAVYGQTPSIPFGSNDSYEHGTMQTYQTSTQADAVTQSWYNYWKTNFTRDCGGGRWLAINDYNSQNAYSEGQGYGMLLAAYMGDKTLFDGLLRGYNFGKSNGVMNWIVSCTNNSVSANAATDGDLDAAMAILIANKQWPNTTTPLNYAQEATTLINAIKNTEFTNCNGKTVQKPGNVWGGCNCTNPSYYAVGYYRAFAKHVTADATFWNKAASDGLDLLLSSTNTSTGLNPAWTDQNGTSGGTGDCNNIAASGGGTRNDYQFDAARTPWRIVVDYLWWGTPKAKQYLDKVSTWANGVGVSNIVAGYTTSGSPLPGINWRNSAFTGAFAIGTMSSGNQTMVNNFYQWWVNNSTTSGSAGSGLDDRPYFQNSLRVMYSLVASGNFWNPYAEDNPSTSVTVSITAPTATDFNSGANIEIMVNASTTSGSITGVEFSIDGNVVSTDNSAPYSYSLTNLTPGAHTITVKATNSTGETATATKTINILLGAYRVATPPVIDGTIDAIWSNSSIVSSPLNKTLSGTIANSADLSATFKLLWDNTYLYVLGDINDDTKINDSPEAYNDDAVEVYVDINNDKANAYGANDVQYTFGWNDNTIGANPTGRVSTNISYEIVDKTGGYIFEARIPWATLQGNPAVGQKVGFDFMVNDDDNGGERDSKISWTAATDDAWQNPSLFGTIILQDLISSFLDEEIANLGIYPNPFYDTFTLQNIENVESVEVLDSRGKTMEILKGRTSKVELGESYAKGLYFVKVNYGGKAANFKVIKQ